MDSYINPETKLIEQQGYWLKQSGIFRIKVLRTMFDGKMSGILTGAAGTKCQLCTATYDQIRDLELVKSGFHINRTISAAKEIFSQVNKEEYLILPRSQIFGLTHAPISDLDVVSASLLHSYTCVFRSFMLLVYHLHSRSKNGHQRVLK
ncbi:hypothetical protein LOD99_12130 [Oopsacas minuta]|uniref:Uncharacterized protein n=1 Tax=Oopsacas minuta TaxID=111878 RepID=A0AAV7JHV8_9METZ|nr:hypothetical protein LOD99_12130 [Oopsacas minuta]